MLCSTKNPNLSGQIRRARTAAGPGLTLHDIELIAEPTHLRHNESRHPFHSPPSPLIDGIYELEGDILKLCLSIGGGPNDRPKEFATRAGPPEPVLDVYRRVRTVDTKPDLDDLNNPPEPSQEHKEMH